MSCRNGRNGGRVQGHTGELWKNYFELAMKEEDSVGGEEKQLRTE